MKTIDAIRRSGVTIEAERTIRATAELMEQAAVGAVPVTDGGALVGIVTDRDLVRRGLARGVPLDGRIDSVMTAPAVTVDADADLHDTFGIFRTNGLRRLVVTRGDEIVGVLGIDDLLVDLSSDLDALVRPVAGQVLFGQRDDSVPAVP